MEDIGIKYIHEKEEVKMFTSLLNDMYESNEKEKEKHLLHHKNER